MELFYSNNINDNICTLTEQEAKHCANVLRHKVGDQINVIDGLGNLYLCSIKDISKKDVICQVIKTTTNFGSHPYSLTMAVAPTKNMDRYEWFLEKATEIGVDVIVPIIGEHSERKIVKPERCERILVSAAKQSLKGTFPILEEQCTVIEFIKKQRAGLKLIAFCEENEKYSLPSRLNSYLSNTPVLPQITILIGPEGDFSDNEIKLALENGYSPIHLGESRLRTETAAIAAVTCVYFNLN